MRVKVDYLCICDFRKYLYNYFLLLIVLVFLSSCAKDYPPEQFLPSRHNKIPNDVIKVQPSDDDYPPVLHVTEFSEPVPMPGLVNTAGAEDSPFMANDREEFYFFFTPDVREPVETQILDSVTGIYRTKQVDGIWEEPERVMLQKQDKLALDGCEYVHGDSLWFCSAREGYAGLHWFVAYDVNGKWSDWTLADFNTEFAVGELHFYNNHLYYHSERAGGSGGLDLWMLTKGDQGWENPVNLVALNSTGNEGWPCVTDDGMELWFTRTYQGSPAIFRSKRIDNKWQPAELIISQFAGEPVVDKNGNVYFTHHFFKNGNMIEADIYMIKKQ